ncbi:BrnT family toxin [Rhodobacterales bacterium HKCCE4037]|nr:BrnT family toxin [Rhodobacterales bacterium HKCCE4037]
MEYDPEKRAKTLELRGLDMARAGEVFEGPHLTFRDRRQDYGEERWVTFGHLDGRLVTFAWTPRGDALRVISLRKANGREEKRYGTRLR